MQVYLFDTYKLSVNLLQTVLAYLYCKLLTATIEKSKMLKSLSAISTPRLNTLLCVHLVPINVIVYNEPNGEI